MSNDTTLVINKCGLKFTPPSIIVTYPNYKDNKLRARTIPLRNFNVTSSAGKIVDDLKKLSPSYDKYLGQVSQHQLVKLVQMIKDHKNGVDRNEIISQVNIYIR